MKLLTYQANVSATVWTAIAVIPWDVSKVATEEFIRRSNNFTSPAMLEQKWVLK